MQIPCSHRFAIRFREGITGKPVLPETVGLKLKNSIDHLQLRRAVVRRDGPVPDEQHVKGLKKFSWRAIKRFSHAREKEELRQ
jgi:hypothetical protein